ncbi:two-component system, OmpR family, response regulator VicR [Alkalispirochaeta americana]|uniref:Two-component system, OmpR family, response regulator VicR n=1 Tax=Alkalispirochaeta americana TaxID=159291 RepID=A0A1N6N9J6_9SPIO|nr:response regulator transcription factor [Alkalispirochaeta americana]SIP88728.1 two-component system, OmpR family, response regulator VicR [Alkalispirochaeta americana]
MSRILVVDDEPAIVNLLVFILEDQGYRVKSADRGDTALEIVREWIPDLVILDIGLPGIGGLEVCRVLHDKGLPVLVLSSHDKDDQVVEGLEEGADDYVTKPFNHRELLLRVDKLLVRTRNQGDPEVGPGGGVKGSFLQQPLVLGELRIDPLRGEVFRGEAALQLTPTEFRLLSLLALAPGHPVAVETILERIWNSTDWEGGAEMVKVNIRRLRQKIEPDPSRPVYILNRRGMGYFLAEE